MATTSIVMKSRKNAQYILSFLEPEGASSPVSWVRQYNFRDHIRSQNKGWIGLQKERGV